MAAASTAAKFPDRPQKLPFNGARSSAPNLRHTLCGLVFARTLFGEDAVGQGDGEKGASRGDDDVLLAAERVGAGAAAHAVGPV